MVSKKYTVELTKSAAKEFKKLQRPVKENVLEAFQFLSQNPYSELFKIKKLKGVDSLYRIRIGDYRIVFEIKKQKLVILIIRIGHRKDVYEKI